MTIGIAILRLGHERRYFLLRLAPELAEHPGVIRTWVRRVRWVR